MSKGLCRHDEIMRYIKTFNLYNMRMPTRKETMFDCKIDRGPLQRIIGRLVEKKKLIPFPKGTLEFKIND